MGHVDHGKTTLLDYIRKANVAGREAGGITQAISAYQAKHGDSVLTFIDTPGHEAFTNMRSRGAKVADLAVLVVAASEGVKPQTEEAAKILEESKTPYVIAFTKMDAPGANVEKTKADLAGIGVLVEGYGGSISYQPVSGVTGEGINDLLDLLVLASEVEDLTYDPKAPATGIILEARSNKRRGNEAVLIVTDGTLHYGDEISTPSASGKVKVLEDFLGKPAKSIPAGAPALVVGFDAIPKVGEELAAGSLVALSEKNEAVVLENEYVEPVDDVFAIILKASDAGSLEVLSQIVGSMTGPKDIPVKIISSGVGEISDVDVKLGASAHATVVGFKTKIDKVAASYADVHKVKVFSSEIVYELVQSLEALFAEDAGPEVTARLSVLALFNQKRLDEQLVGGRLEEGTMKPKQQFVIYREGEEVGRGRIITIRQQKDTLPEASAVMEIGLVVNSPVEIAVDDEIRIERQ
jgi:translation initiation factor IF-2